MVFWFVFPSAANQNPQEAGPAARLGSAGEFTQAGALGAVGSTLKHKAALAAAPVGSKKKKTPNILDTKGRRIRACEGGQDKSDHYQVRGKN